MLTELRAVLEKWRGARFSGKGSRPLRLLDPRECIAETWDALARAIEALDDIAEDALYHAVAMSPEAAEDIRTRLLHMGYSHSWAVARLRSEETKP